MSNSVIHTAMYTLLISILKSYKLYPSNILALGDDELVWLPSWSSDHQMWGIVSSRDLVEQGKSIAPSAKLYAQKLESYRITGMMQLSYGLHAQINTLESTKWSKFFETVVKHSMPYWLLVIDVKLPWYYEEQSRVWSQTQVTKDTVILSSRTQKKQVYTHEQLQFLPVDGQDELYRKVQNTQQYYTMNLSDIKKLSSQYFESVTVLDLKGRKLSKVADHVLLVCQMWGPDWKVKVKA